MWLFGGILILLINKIRFCLIILFINGKYLFLCVFICLFLYFYYILLVFYYFISTKSEKLIKKYKKFSENLILISTLVDN